MTRIERGWLGKIDLIFKFGAPEQGRFGALASGLETRPKIKKYSNNYITNFAEKVL